jgi:PAS domain S-box-containing protein
MKRLDDKKTIDYKQIFDHSPAAKLIIAADAPVFTILDVNEAYLLRTNSTRDDLVGKSVFSVFPANPDDLVSENIALTIDSFEKVIETRQPHTISDYRYDIPVRGSDKFEERYWTTTNTPILDEEGNVTYLIHSPVNTTALHTMEKRAQERLFSTLMQAPVGIGIFIGPEFRVELINPPLCKLFGTTPDEIFGKPVFDVLKHAKGRGFEDLLERVMKTGIPHVGEAVTVPLVRQGILEEVYVNFVYEPFRESDGTISGVISVATEVTEEVLIRMKLKEAEERTRLAVSATGLGTFDLHYETDDLVTSAVFAEIYGYEKPVSRAEYLKVVHPEDLYIHQQAHKRALETGNLQYELRLVWPDKSIRWIRVKGKVIYEGGHAVRLLGTVLDITEQVEAKQEQQKLIKLVSDSEELLRNITSAVPTGLWTADADGSVTYINQTWIEWTGMPYEAHLGRGWINGLVKDDRRMIASNLIQAARSRAVFEVEFRFHHVDEKIHWAVASGSPQYNEEGEFTGYIGALVDITDLKHLQQQKDDFIGIASHELKTPVTSIKAYTQVLERMMLKSGKERDAELIRKLDSQVNRLTKLIEDLLDVTKLNSGKLQFNDRHFDFNELVRELLEDLQRTTENHLLIPKLAPTVIVFGDRERIGQVITNLITNSIKYSPNADKIIIKSAVVGNDIQLCVKDFGIGIPEANLNRVFEQFYRVSGEMQHTFPGLGLGLYITSEIIKRENGKIWVSSQEGKGSTFCFSLPLVKENT